MSEPDKKSSEAAGAQPLSAKSNPPVFDKQSFENAGAQQTTGLGSEIVSMLKQNKKYWLLPIIAILLVFGVLIILGSTAAAPFIYSLF